METEKEYWVLFIQNTTDYIRDRLDLIPEMFEELSETSIQPCFPGWEEIFENSHINADLNPIPEDYVIIGRALAYLSSRFARPFTIRNVGELFLTPVLEDPREFSEPSLAPSFRSLIDNRTEEEVKLLFGTALLQERTGIKINPDDFPRPWLGTYT